MTLYDELVLALGMLPFVEDTNPASLPTADQKWINLVNGTNYTDPNGNVRRWDGLKGYDKQSVIAFYIFTEYLRNNNETYTTTGVVKNDAKNAQVIDPTPKYIKAYNQFIEAYQGSMSVNTPVVLINGFGTVGLDYYNNKSVQVSLLRFLSDSNELDETAYPDFEFRLYEPQNSFGI